MRFHKYIKGLASGIHTEGGHVALAWMTFTAVSLPRSITKHLPTNQEAARASIRYLPLIGIIIGMIAALAFLFSQFIFRSYGMTILVSIVVPIILTAAFHERGLVGFFDSLAKPSNGSGTLALVLTVFAKYKALLLVSASLVPFVLIAAHAFSRLSSATFIFEKSPGRQRAGVIDFTILTVFGLLPIVLMGHAIFLIVPVALWIFRALLGYWFTRRLGNYNGHALDTTQQLCELGFYVAVAIIIRFAPIT